MPLTSGSRFEPRLSRTFALAATSPAVAPASVHPRVLGRVLVSLRAVRASARSLARPGTVAIRRRAQLKVCRIAAPRMLTAMVQLVPGGHRTVSLLPRIDVCADDAARVAEAEVARPARRPCPGPRPALVRAATVHLAPESICHGPGERSPTSGAQLPGAHGRRDSWVDNDNSPGQVRRHLTGAAAWRRSLPVIPLLIWAYLERWTAPPRSGSGFS